MDNYLLELALMLHRGELRVGQLGDVTVMHDDFVEGSKVFEAISKGWPLVLSSLKSYLETNRVLYAPWYEKAPAAS